MPEVEAASINVVERFWILVFDGADSVGAILIGNMCVGSSPMDETVEFEDRN
jgi:hypothetical protein